jgi:plasmid stability protein
VFRERAVARSLRSRDGEAGLDQGPGLEPEVHASDSPEKAELREALRRALLQEPPLPFKELAAMMRALTAGRKHTPAEVLVRESRDER